MQHGSFFSAIERHRWPRSYKQISIFLPTTFSHAIEEVAFGYVQINRSNVSISLLEMASAKYHIQNFMNKITRALKEGMVYQS